MNDVARALALDERLRRDFIPATLPASKGSMVARFSRGRAGDARCAARAVATVRVRLDRAAGVWISVAIADTSDGFYSWRGRLADREFAETETTAWCLFARQFSELALRRRSGSSEWIDTKPRSFDTDTCDVLEEPL
ncbi:MAG: hypothetical protein M4D80_17145 [Myxococcota bacterium]|nr:hypothetical protein [Deltaproteobacteria bacterium]MDQ3336895.1 hypothetical protein [Myxococcota bacterium]